MPLAVIVDVRLGVGVPVPLFEGDTPGDNDAVGVDVRVPVSVDEEDSVAEEVVLGVRVPEPVGVGVPVAVFDPAPSPAAGGMSGAGRTTTAG